jgi:NTF2-related export protein 1/2
MSILVLVSGSVQYIQEGKDTLPRGFTENVVLVPNRDAYDPKAPRGLKRWLIQSQTFRLVT